MKFISIAMLLALLATATNTQVPANVKEAFAKKFPKAQEVNWQEIETDQDTEYEASFVDARKEKSSLFLSNGQWLETTTWLDEESEMPANVKSTLKEELEGELSYDVLKWVEKQDLAYYEVTVTDEDDTEWTARITKDGKLLDLQ